MFNQIANTHQKQFFLFKMDGDFKEETTQNTNWCKPVGTVNFVDSSYAPSGTTFRGNYWAKPLTPESNYLTFNPSLFPKNYGTVEFVCQPSGTAGVKQLGISVYNGTRIAEFGKTWVNSQFGATLETWINAWYGAGDTVYYPKRFYFLIFYSPYKTGNKLYRIEGNNSLTMTAQFSVTPPTQTLPKFGNSLTYSQVFAFKSFSGGDGNGGVNQYFKISDTYSETPTYSRQDI